MLVYLDTIIAFVVVMLGFSLLITLFNQTVSAFLGLRGTNLLWGIETMLRTLDPKLSSDAKKIATRILSSPVVSDSIFARLADDIPIFGRLVRRWKLANAIGPEAFTRSLREVGDHLAGSNPDLSKAITALIEQVDPEVVRKLKNVNEAFSKLNPPPGFQVQVDDYLKRLGNSAQQSIGRLEAWFNVAMNRVSQRFTMHMRIITVVCAFVLAFGIHLDTFALANQLLGSPELRAQAVSQSSAMLAEAQAILGDQATGKPFSAPSDHTSSPEVLKSSMQQLIKNDIKPDEAQPGKLDSLPQFNSRAEAEKWLNDNLSPNVPAQRRQELSTIYGHYVVTGLKQKATDVAAILSKTGLDLVPQERTWATFKQGPFAFFFHFDNMRNFVGVLLTACLLAMGAPFWYNALKTLTSLRPQVATKQDQQRQEAAAS